MRILVSVIWHYAKQWPHLVTYFVLLTTVLVALWVVDPLLGQYIVDKVSSFGSADFNQRNFLQWLVVWVVIVLLLSMVQAGHKMVSWRILNQVYVNFQRDTFSHILHMDVSQHVTRRAGAMIKKIDNAADQIWDLGFQIFQVILPPVLSGIAFLILAFQVNVELATIVTVMLTVYGVMLIGVTQLAHPMQSRISRIWVSVIGRAYDVNANILPTKSAAGEAREVQRMNYWNSRGLAMQNRTDWYWGLLEGFNIYMLLRVLVLGIGFFLIAGDRLTLGELFFFLFITFRLITPIEVIGSFLPKWNEKIEKVRMGVQMGQLPSLVQNTHAGAQLKAIKGELKFNDVSFSYDASQPTTADDFNDAEEEEIDILDPRVNIHESAMKSVNAPLPVLQRSTKRRSNMRHDTIEHLSLTIAPGEHIALVGHSGAGKSTIAALINRFYDVTSGGISIDGTDIRQLDLHWWRNHIGLVLQDNSMFNDTIMENIRYASPKASDEDVIAAAKRASAHDFIMEMPEAYLTGIGERGIRLSGGERQRLAIARAILKKPSIIVLDEATSALDSKTEQAVQAGIEELIADRTAVIIAHRLSTVRACDRIAVLDQGKLIACAPHQELLKNCPIYKEMVDLQSHGMLAE